MLEKVIANVAVALRPQGFKRHGKILSVIANDNLGIVEFQKSDKNSNSQIIFTVNLGVVCARLLDPGRTKLERATVVDAHLRTRLGMLLEPPNDIWWELTTSTDYEVLSKEISTLVLMRAVPFLDTYVHTDALIALWESGRSPGLTAGQRARFLSELKVLRPKTVDG